MTSRQKKPASPKPGVAAIEAVEPESVPLSPVLPAAVSARPADSMPAMLAAVAGQSAQVQGKVEECVVELAAVNDELNHQTASESPLRDMQGAIVRNREIETKVQECADDLATINGVLDVEIRERAVLDRELTVAAAALEQSQAVAAAATYRSLHDALTGLPNAILFNDRLSMALSQAKRHGWKLAVMFIDLDKFKDINDRLGHDAGDEVLRVIAKHLQELVRSGDSIGRRSGDEFLFLMLEANNEADVAALARKIIASIGDDCRISAADVRVRPSIGIALYPAHGTTAGELLANADRAMYAAKRQPDGFTFFGDVVPS